MPLLIGQEIGRKGHGELDSNPHHAVRLTLQHSVPSIGGPAARDGFYVVNYLLIWVSYFANNRFSPEKAFTKLLLRKRILFIMLIKIHR